MTGGNRSSPDDDRSYHTYEIGSEEQPSDAVVSAVAAMTNQSPLELEPLYEAVEPDAMDALFGSTAIDRPRTDRFTFTFAGCEVIVESDRVHVCKPDE